ncbi:MAG: hypothetical protein PHN33_02685 [Candidatus Peribacteraceae bacterium]|nr:hypothetical protein [Candidatus Peribacteraceae bacterium]
MAAKAPHKRHKDLSTIDVRQNIEKFIEGEGKDKGRHPDERYASFDYCYNYFQSFRERGRIEDICNADNLQQSCLQLGFYLASWGMLRGSSFLLSKSARHYIRLFESLVRLDRRLWEIDVDSYTNESISILLNAKEAICEALGCDNAVSDTLVTKVMLGIFGNIPAFDQFFCRGFGVGVVNRNSLFRIRELYERNTDVLNGVSINTLDFQTGKETTRRYSKAKLIDMVGFIEGLA